jgi:hypothetical protein
VSIGILTIGRRSDGNRESHNGRLAWGCLCNVSLVFVALVRHVGAAAALTIQLVAVQVLCAGEALFTAFVSAL